MNFLVADGGGWALLSYRPVTTVQVLEVIGGTPGGVLELLRARGLSVALGDSDQQAWARAILAVERRALTRGAGARISRRATRIGGRRLSTRAAKPLTNRQVSAA